MKIGVKAVLAVGLLAAASPGAVSAQPAPSAAQAAPAGPPNMDAFNAAWRVRIAELAKSPDAHLAANKKVALDFLFGLVLAAQGKEPIEDVTNRYLDPGYIQHDPNIPTGRDGFARWFKAGAMTPDTPTAPKVNLRDIGLPTMVQAVAEGDYVVTLSQHLFPDEVNPGQKFMWYHIGYFRLKDGKIVEHWSEGMKGAYWCRLGLCDPKN